MHLDKKQKMDYLHLIRDKKTKGLVRQIAQNDPKETSLRFYKIDFDADLSLALGHALIGNTHLRHLTLENLVLTEEAAHALAQGMAQSKITYLDLRGCCQENPSQESSSQGSICDIFYRGIQASTTIQEIHLMQSLTNDPGNAWRDALLGVSSIEMNIPNGHGYNQAFSDILSRATLLRELCVVLEEAEPNDIAILTHGLSQNTSLTSLCLRNLFINCQYVQLLFAQGLSPNSSLTKLELSFYGINDGCVELLVDHWLPNCPLRHLDLINNEIGPTGALRLIQAMAAHPTMLKLDLCSNKDIGYEGLRLIGNELPNLQRLTYLDLEECSIWDDDLEHESDDESEDESEEAREQTKVHQQAGQALLDGIKHNFSIMELVVRDNLFPGKLVSEIFFYCELNKMGRRLLATQEGHNLASSVWCHILAKCQCQHNFGTSLMYFFLKEQPTLVQQPRYHYE